MILLYSLTSWSDYVPVLQVILLYSLTSWSDYVPVLQVMLHVLYSLTWWSDYMYTCVAGDVAHVMCHRWHCTYCTHWHHEVTVFTDIMNWLCICVAGLVAHAVLIHTMKWLSLHMLQVRLHMLYLFTPWSDCMHICCSWCCTCRTVACWRGKQTKSAFSWLPRWGRKMV